MRSRHPVGKNPTATDSGKEKSSGLSVYLRLIQYSKKYWLQITIAIVGFALVAGMNAVFTWLIQPLLDEGFTNRNPQVIRWMPMAVAAIFIVRSIGSYLGIYYIGRVGHLVVQELRGAMYDKLLYLPADYYESTASGSILSKFTFDVERVASASSKSLTILAREGLQVLFSLGLMFYLSWKLTIVLLVISPLIYLIVNYASKRFRMISHRIQASIGDITRRVEEIVGGHVIVKVFNAEHYEKDRFSAVNKKNRRNQFKLVATKALNTPLVQMIVGIAFAIVIYVAFLPSVSADMTSGTFMSFVAAVMMLLNAARRLTIVNETLQSGIAASESVFSLVDKSSQVDAGTVTLSRCKGQIDFEAVFFKYTNKTESALNDVSFHAESGELIALVGKSGSGKSTLVKLLPRFYDVLSGEIRLDNIPIKEIKLADLRRQIAMVNQDVVLFNDTVENNIAYAMPGKTKHDIREAARTAYASEFIEKLPGTYDAMVGDKGVLLSGGQQQRIAIARALLKDSPILIFDEATSSLDSESEYYIQEALKEIRKNRTTFVIAHRLSTIESADKILVMDGGTIVEQGRHDELLKQNGVYARLYNRQFKSSSTQVVNG